MSALSRFYGQEECASLSRNNKYTFMKRKGFRNIVRQAAIVLSAIVALSASGHGQEEAPAPLAPSIEAAEQLVKRVTPEYASRVHLRLQAGQATPTIEGKGQDIIVSADNVRECIRAYGYYLRHVARVHLSWNGDNRSAAEFIVPEETIQVPATLPLNFAFNYCTLSYSGAHWSPERWMQEIDRLALNGFHYVLVTSGLEKVWQRFLKEMGYANPAGFIANPCFSAWWNMGNLEGEGGPVSASLINSEAALGKAIVARLVELGMEPVLQGYVGFIPHDFSKNKGDILDQGNWVDGYKRPSVLRPDRESYMTAARIWYKHLEKVYGYKAKAFGGDLFHEGGKTGDVNLGEAAANVQKVMQEVSPGSLWFLQAWAGNPKPELLNGTSEKYTVILQLQKDLSPDANIQYNYGERRYVWCELANFGGNQGLYGGYEILERMSGDSGGASGFGLLSEGVETNPLYYELFFERINNREVINRKDFLTRYVLARYGSKDEKLVEALGILVDSVYKPDRVREGCVENIMCARPSLDAVKASTWSNGHVYYDPEDVKSAGKLMLEAAKKDPKLLTCSPFRYDLADVCRQALAEKARATLPRCKEAHASGDKAAFTKESAEFCSLISLTAEVLATHEDFLLSTFLSGAAQRAPKDKGVMVRCLRQLITTWSPQPGKSLNDYAHRQFAELMKGYYLPRWQAFFRSLGGGKSGRVRETVNTNNGERVVTRTQENNQVDSIERAFPAGKTALIKKPQGDLLKLAEKALK